MRSTKIVKRDWRISLSGAAGMAIVLLSTIAAAGQDLARRAGTRGPYPRLPGAVTKAPAWLGANAPFDIAKCFEQVPPGKNAAPLYLDALFEFGSDLETCFPEGPQRDQRSKAAKDRSERYNNLTQPAYADPKRELDGAAVDELIKLYDAGYRKLAEAQRLDRCVFEIGLGVSALVPHAQVARQVFRVSSLKVQRDVQRGDLPAAIHEIDVVLRLARDLRPRGVTICQMVADAISQAVFSSMIPTIMASPRLRAEQCERLIKVLETHEAKSLDGYVEGLRADFMSVRATLENVVHHQSDLAKALGLKPGESVVRALLKFAGPGKPSAGTDAGSGEDWDALVARATPADVSRHAKEITGYYRKVLDFDGVPYAKRLTRIEALKALTGTDPLARIAGLSLDPATIEALARAGSRTTTSLRAAECLLALRRWQMSHRESPKNLASVTRGVGLKTIPLDPYDDKPFRLITVNGQPIVYSVGRDGKDDGGLVDSNRDQKPAGDLIYRLPAIEEKQPLRP